jgi:type I restriction enzyme M protein
VQLDRYVAAHRSEVVAAVEMWWDKYRVTLKHIEADRDSAATRLTAFLRDLGYVTNQPDAIGTR